MKKIQNNKLFKELSIESDYVDPEKVFQHLRSVAKRMNPAYKRAVAFRKKDPLHYRLRQELNVLRRKLHPDEYIKIVQTLAEASLAEKDRFLLEVRKRMEGHG